ncbi:aldo/keto reductase [Haloarcula sp. GH36]|uniref:aldo/keto reductase n=1 Tax=Haloarcula montana TaxID=3111776 RepID=UPI002D78D2D1|nr:aldo/keto reductase [Haloarcula sp. GH36]
MHDVSAGNADVPALGVGTFQMDDGECREAVRTALELGYRHVDTAEYYGNEAAVGDAIEASAVDRDDVFVTTKVWRSNLRADDVRRAARASLDRLGLDSVDLLLIHWPHPRVPVGETLGAMADLRAEGVVEHVGVSNFTRSQLARARRAVDIPIVADQVEYHPYKDQRDLREYCADNDLALTAYSPLARGDVLDDPILDSIGDGYGKSPAQVALRWLVQQEGVVAIPKARSRDHLEANLDVFDFSLSRAEMQRIQDRTGSIGRRLRNQLPKLVRSFPL